MLDGPPLDYKAGYRLTSKYMLPANANRYINLSRPETGLVRPAAGLWFLTVRGFSSGDVTHFEGWSGVTGMPVGDSGDGWSIYSGSSGYIIR